MEEYPSVLSLIRAQKVKFYNKPVNNHTKLVIMLNVSELQRLADEVPISNSIYNDLIALMEGTVSRILVVGVFIEIGTPKEKRESLIYKFPSE
jgi:hypothetical protein